jgi:hypothetical protein
MFGEDGFLRCPCCKERFIEWDGVESELLNETFCSDDCLSDTEAEHNEGLAHVRYESHSSNFI